MSSSQRFTYLFNKYQKGTCSEIEARELMDFLEDPTNDQLIKADAYNFWNTLPCSIENDSQDGIMSELHKRIRKYERETNKHRFINNRFADFLLKTAAVLTIPLILYSGYLTFTAGGQKNYASDVVIHSVNVPAGVRTDFILSDGSHVWLNSGSVFKYPDQFKGKLREVELIGEGYFDIAKDTDHPFIVKSGVLNVEVKGTSFDVISYPEDTQVEVIVESGLVNLFTGQYEGRKHLAALNPGERMTYDRNGYSASVSQVDATKYTVWKNGILVFRDDPMSEVAKRLSHKFNVDIELQSPGIAEYVYTATFVDESLFQILDLLKISAPLDYTFIEQKKLNDNSFSRSKVIISTTKIQPMKNR